MRVAFEWASRFESRPVGLDLLYCELSAGRSPCESKEADVPNRSTPEPVGA